MKVLQINSVCGIRSTGRIATDIHSILESQGHESYIAYGRENPMNSNHTIRIGSKMDNYVHILKTRVLDKHGFGSKRATKKFIEEIKQMNFDIIHLHNIHGYYINVEMLFEYLKEAKKPVIWTLHDCWPFTGHCAYFEYSGCSCWKVDNRQKCIQKRSYPSSLLINNSLNNFERKKEAFTGVENLTIVTPSQWLADLVQASFLKDYPVEVIHNGIDLSVFKPTPSNFRELHKLKGKFVILGVASIWDKRKGLDYFIELAEKLDSDYQIVVVGVTDKQVARLPKSIIGITRTNNTEELAQIYSAADVFVNPTLEDNFPTTNIESLACGTPVITFNAGGSPESLTEKCGIIVEKSDTDKLIEELRTLRMRNINEIECVKRAQTFNKKDRYKDYLNLYTS